MGSCQGVGKGGSRERPGRALRARDGDEVNAAPAWADRTVEAIRRVSGRAERFIDGRVDHRRLQYALHAAVASSRFEVRIGNETRVIRGGGTRGRESTPGMHERTVH